MTWQYDDGGREAAGYKGTTGDCVTRAIAIACELPYQEVYDALNIARQNPEKASPGTRRKLMNSSARTMVAILTASATSTESCRISSILSRRIRWMATITRAISCADRPSACLPGTRSPGERIRSMETASRVAMPPGHLP